MGFWAKRILVMLLVIVGAVLFIIYMPQQQTLDENGQPVEKKSIQSNMAKFYEEFGLVSKDKIEEKYGEFVIPLDESEVDLSQQIAALAAERISANDAYDFRDTFKNRAFAKDTTLMGNAETYVSEEGMELIWHLNQDFIVRHRFVSKNNIPGMLGELAGAIDANFSGAVNVHYCSRQRVMVITDKDAPVLNVNCTLLPRN